MCSGGFCLRRGSRLRLVVVPAQRRRSGLGAAVVHLVAQLVQAAHGDQQLGRVIQLDAELAAVPITGGDGHLGVAGLADVQALDLHTLVFAVAVGPVDQAAQLGLGETVDELSVAHDLEALATTTTARGLAGRDLGLGLLLHGCLLYGLGTCEIRLDLLCTFFGHA